MPACAPALRRLELWKWLTTEGQHVARLETRVGGVHRLATFEGAAGHQHFAIRRHRVPAHAPVRETHRRTRRDPAKLCAIEFRTHGLARQRLHLPARDRGRTRAQQLFQRLRAGGRDAREPEGQQRGERVFAGVDAHQPRYSELVMPSIWSAACTTLLFISKLRCATISATSSSTSCTL